MGHNVHDALPFARGQTAGSVLLANPSGSGAMVSQIPTYPLYDTDGTNAAANKTAGINAGVPTFYRNDLASKCYLVLASMTDPNAAAKVTAGTAAGGVATIENKVLRAVQNGTGAALVVTAIGMAVQFDTSAGRNGVVVNTKTGTGGKMSKPIDDAYPVNYSIAAGDWFYVVEQGLTLVTTSSSPSNGGEAKGNGDGTFTTAGQGTAVCGTFRSCYNTGNQALMDVASGITPVQTYG